ncbi:MAG TPA: RluA family pseudouridine synthase [Clostridiales bacterium]|nr:RluA family pseudouridine synthase [Clostridiales bacterium]
MEIIELEAMNCDAGKRIDVFLAEKIDGYSRSYLKKVIEDKLVTVCGEVKKANYKLKLGDKIKVLMPSPVNLEIKPEDIDIDVIYEDDVLLVVNKPQGMVVHPAHGNYSGTLVNALLKRCHGLSGINGVIRPGIVHRIDKNTSGVIVVAKTNEAHLDLSQQLKNHTIERKYIALLEGRLKEETGTIDAPIGRDPFNRKKMAVTSKNSKNAVTHFRVLELFKANTLIEAKLETGRTHQIRVHMAYIGHPVVGDMVYGYKKQRFKLQGQLLHAALLGFVHPVTKKYMEFTAPLPDYFEKILKTLRNDL